MCVDLLDTAWGVAMCRIVVSFTRVYRVGVAFSFVRVALLLAVVLCWVDHCCDSWVLLTLFCLLRVTRTVMYSLLLTISAIQPAGLTSGDPE